MKIIGYTCAYNEADMIPYAMPYVEAFGYDKFIVYDNQSTDNTVELLQKYPRVEVREWNTNGKFDDASKCQLQAHSFEEAREIAKIGTQEEELVWFTWTDFDEVLFYNADCDFKGIMEGDYYSRGYNCFYKNMVNLFMPYEHRNESPINIMGDNKLVHSIPGIRGSIWVGGMKPTMLAVNAFDGMRFFGGNHYSFARMAQGKRIKSYDDCCRIYGFHLKFVDKPVLLKKWQNYAVREGAGKDTYEKLLKRFNDIYEQQYSLSFPLSDYFVQDYFNSGLHNKTISYNGLMSV